jgi:hypothetical protein
MYSMSFSSSDVSLLVVGQGPARERGHVLLARMGFNCACDSCSQELRCGREVAKLTLSETTRSVFFSDPNGQRSLRTKCCYACPLLEIWCCLSCFVGFFSYGRSIQQMAAILTGVHYYFLLQLRADHAGNMLLLMLQWYNLLHIPSTWPVYGSR